MHLPHSLITHYYSNSEKRRLGQTIANYARKIPRENDRFLWSEAVTARESIGHKKDVEWG
jgi:hypothetical protein